MAVFVAFITFPRFNTATSPGTHFTPIFISFFCHPIWNWDGRRKQRYLGSLPSYLGSEGNLTECELGIQCTNIEAHYPPQWRIKEPYKVQGQNYSIGLPRTPWYPWGCSRVLDVKLACIRAEGKCHHVTVLAQPFVWSQAVVLTAPLWQVTYLQGVNLSNKWRPIWIWNNIL